MLFKSTNITNGFPIFICYYTINTLYENEIRNLIKSLKKLHLPYIIYGVFSLGSWLFNTGYKAEFVSDMMKKYDTKLTWIDADAVVIRSPILLKELIKKNSNCCVYIRHKDKLYPLNSSIVYFNNNDISKRIIYEWKQECINNDYKLWDQKCLELVYNKKKHLFDLFPRPYAKKAKKTGKRVILQNQISNSSMDIINNDVDYLRYLASHDEAILEISQKNINSIQDLKNEAIIHYNINKHKYKVLYTFNPYIFLVSYFSQLKCFIYKHKYNENAQVKTYIDFDNIYYMYIKYKYSFKLQKTKYNIDHMYASEVIYSYIQ